MSRSEPGGVTEGMKGGGYYDAHSEYQRRVVEGGDSTIRSLVGELDLEGAAPTLVVADYGAGTGASSVHAVGTAIAAARKLDPELPVWALHNDVLSSDFTQLFAAIGGDGGYLGGPGGPVFPAAAGGSFFSQVVPSGSVHLGLCSNAAHWYRRQPQVEPCEGIYYSQVPARVRDRLAREAAEDWLAFLEARAAELASGARLLVQGIATVPADGEAPERVSAGKLLAVMREAAVELADEGKLEREALDRYVFPVYCRSAEEATAPLRESLSAEFELHSAPVEEVPNPYWEQLQREGDPAAYADAYTAFVRAFSESTMREHLFGPSSPDPDAACERFFERFRDLTAADPERGRYEAWILRLALIRR